MSAAGTREERVEFVERVALDPSPDGRIAGSARGRKEGRAPSEGPGRLRVREEAAAEAARHLAAGGILAHPTSTVYGLGADARPELDAEVSRLKRRPPERPLIRLAADAEAVRARLAPGAWDRRAQRLADAFWPGPLTLVLEDGTPHGLAVRVDAHPVVRRVLALHGGLVSSTSLNRSGEAPVRTPEGVRRVLASLPAARRPVVFLAAGALPPSAPSTLLSLRGRPARLLRPGAVPAERLEACLGEGLDR